MKMFMICLNSIALIIDIGAGIESGNYVWFLVSALFGLLILKDIFE